MSSAVAVRDDLNVLVISQDDRELIRKTYAKELSEPEFNMLIAESQHRGLDIVKGEIRAIKFNGQLSIFPTVHGIRRIASRSGFLDGIEGPFWCGKDGKWLEFWNDEKTPPAAAKVIVHRKDRAKPTVGVAVWNERKQTYSKDGQARLMPTWAKMPALMLGKVAETDALKRSGLIGDEQVWIEEDDVVDGMEMHVVENRKDTANRRLHGAVASKGLGGHPAARALAAQVRPGITSLADPEVTASDMHAAADLAEHLDPAYVEGLIDGEYNLADGPEAPTDAEGHDCDRALWREVISTAIESDYGASAPQFMSQAKSEPWRFIDLIEFAPAQRYLSHYKTAAQNAGVSPDEIYRAMKLNAERRQIGDEVEKRQDPADVAVKTWDAFWKQLARRNLTAGDFESLVGCKPATFDSPQAALDAYREAEAEIPVSEQALPGFDEMRDPNRFTA